MIKGRIGYLKKSVALLVMLLPLMLIPAVGAAVVLSAPAISAPQPQVVTTGNFDRVAIAVSAGLAVGLATLAAGFAISSAGTAAISALAEKPETFFRSFLVVALAEALAIYGLIMGILLWLKL
jgi:V/A-type H+/Na+-transporting ATPase subunit K